MNETIAQYIEDLPKERAEVVCALNQIILGLYPEAEVSMKYKMPTYEEKQGWVALANQKHYVSLYTCSATHLATFKQRQPDIKTGKGCINFKPSETLPIDDIRQVIKHAIEHPKGLE